jgi:benzylsuccinate CoA-transferase BbsF subunit
VPDDLPLSDVNVLDLTWVMAGPAATRVLADYGATVLRIESTKRIDTGRTIVPFVGNQPGPESAIRFQDINAGKLGMTLDMTKEQGRAVFLDLVRWADVVVESFSPKVMRGWGLDYEALRKAKPDVVMLSTCLMGQTGPMSKFAGFGSLAAAISGFYDVTGWPDRPPAGPFGAYTDTIAPRFAAFAILAALDERRRTGRGQYIDQSQAESALHFLGPALLDYVANGRVQTRAGNRDSQMAPHGAYPAADDAFDRLSAGAFDRLSAGAFDKLSAGDRWVAIAVETNEQWRALCEVMGRPELAGDERFVTASARLTHEEELDAIVAGWTQTRDEYEIEAALQARGVPAHVVQNSNQVFADPQLAHRGQFVQVEHAVLGPITIEQSHFRLSRTPARVERPAPMLGEHNHHVLSEILGYSDERIASLVAAGALE